VTRAEVDRAIANVRQQAGLSEEDFWSAVEAQGFTRDGYRADVRRQVLRLKVLNTRARGRVNITEEQVRERYNLTVARQNHGGSYNVAQIVVPVASDASAADVAAAREQATQIRAGISTIDQFETQMAQVGGGDLGMLEEGDLPHALEETIADLHPGDISQPVRGPAGFHIFLLRARESGQSAPGYQSARMQIWQQMMEEAMAQQEEIFLAELRRQAVIDIRL
jgi:peptidyl-prolyl cis-trans isomerase SurA